MALSHRKEIVFRLCDEEHGSPRAVPETSGKGFAQLPPTNVREAVLPAGSVAGVGRGGGRAVVAGHSQYLQGDAACGAELHLPQCLGAPGEGSAAPGVELSPAMLTAWDGAQVSVRSLLCCPGFCMFKGTFSDRN